MELSMRHIRISTMRIKMKLREIRFLQKIPKRAKHISMHDWLLGITGSLGSNTMIERHWINMWNHYAGMLFKWIVKCVSPP